MREIKFRITLKEKIGAKRKINVVYSFEQLINGNMWDTQRWDNERRSEFIGSKDSIGNDIFEDDILISPSGLPFVVFWHEEELRWALTQGKIIFNLNAGLYCVAGNIFDNPELL